MCDIMSSGSIQFKWSGDVPVSPIFDQSICDVVPRQARVAWYPKYVDYDSLIQNLFDQIEDF